MSASKRRRVVVSLEKKLEALDRIDKGESLKKIASDYGVGCVTVGDWKRNRDKLEKWKNKTSHSRLKLSQRKSMKTSDYHKLGDALFSWFVQHREKGAPISGPILQAKALSLRPLFPEETGSFTASSGWLDRWKKRHGIGRFKPNICRETSSADKISIEEEERQEQRDCDYSWDQIHNCNKTDSGLDEDSISHADAFAALQIALTYVKHQGQATPVDVFVIEKWRDIAGRKSICMETSEENKNIELL